MILARDKNSDLMLRKSSVGSVRAKDIPLTLATLAQNRKNVKLVGAKASISRLVMLVLAKVMSKRLL